MKIFYSIDATISMATAFGYPAIKLLKGLLTKVAAGTFSVYSAITIYCDAWNDQEDCILHLWTICMLIKQHSPDNYIDMDKYAY